jgi:choice-of-anchor C domain-containing protein
MVAVAVLLSGATASNGEQIVNGGFESPRLPPGTLFVNMTGNAIGGWTIPDGWSVGLVRDYWPAFEGDQSIDLDGDSGIGATILQSFETVAGRAYSLSFAYANNFDTYTASGRVQVLGAATLLDTTLTHSGSTPYDMNYVAFARWFTADSPLTTLQFTHLGPVWGRGLALDAVSVMMVGETGACCFSSGACLEGTAEDCAAAGGAYQGDGIPCDPDPCGGVPTGSTTWGRMKSLFH